MNYICIDIFHFCYSLCPQHYHEYRAKTIAQTTSETPTSITKSSHPSTQSVISSSSSSSSSRKRHRTNSPSTNIQQNSISTIHNNTSKTSVPKPNRRLSIAVIPASVDIEHPNKGDIIEMENGSRKKFDGVVWRTICSIPGCLIAAQRNELCRKHFIKLNGKPNTAPTMATSMINSGTMSTSNNTLSNDDELGNE